MLRSFLLITLRILWRNKVTSFVNIFSLGVGITAFIFIMLYVHHEMSYDKFNTNYDRIYRLEADDFGKLPPSIGMHVKATLPEVENIALLAMNFKDFIAYYPEGHPEDLKQIEVTRVLADSTTFEVFSFSFIQGDPKTALKEPMTCVLTESIAAKLLGNVNPMGKAVEFNAHTYRVTGIVRDVKMSHIEIDFFVSLSSFAKYYPEGDFNKAGAWSWSGTYLLMKDKIDESKLEYKINEVLTEINNGKLIPIEFKRFHLRPMRDLYFDGEVQKNSYGLHGNFRTILILIAIAVFMLVLASINYVNLTTARSTIRAKEIAVKRVTGSTANLLRFQLITESVVISLISLVAALTIVQLLLPKFNQLTSVNIQIAELNRPLVLVGILGGGMLIGILAGLYPAFYLTAIQPVRLIKGAGVRGSEGSLFRSGLMTFQFALSIIMIVAIMVNFRQLNYLRSANLGFNKEQVIAIVTPDGSPDRYALRETFKTKLKSLSYVEGVAYSAGNPGMSVLNSPTLEINGTRSSIKIFLVDQDYLDVMDMSISKGRSFEVGDQLIENRVPNSRRGGILLNETAVREFGMDSPIGQVIFFQDSSYREVIGVVKDFHFSSLHDKIEPLALSFWSKPMVFASIKITPSNIPATIQAIEKEWKNVWGEAPFNYQFLDETINQHYQRDEQIAKVIGYFTGLAVTIACLGLFALSSFMVSSRIKEIGVRKVLGASVGTIYSMLSWDFLKWILLAVVIATPVAWYLMQIWLNTFAYHIELSVDVFVIAAFIAIGIALLTVTGQSLKVARANPIDSLRYE